MIFASLGNWQKCKTLIEAEEEEMSPNKQLIKQIIDVAVNWNYNWIHSGGRESFLVNLLGYFATIDESLLSTKIDCSIYHTKYFWIF